MLPVVQTDGENGSRNHRCQQGEVGNRLPCRMHSRKRIPREDLHPGSLRGNRSGIVDLLLTVADPNPCNFHDSKICIRGVKNKELYQEISYNPKYQSLTPSFQLHGRAMQLRTQVAMGPYGEESVTLEETAIEGCALQSLLGKIADQRILFGI